MDDTSRSAGDAQAVRVDVGDAVLDGNLDMPERAQGVVLFVHGSSGRHGPRNRYVAGQLRRGGLATLLVDLVADDGEPDDLQSDEPRLDVELLARRVVGACDWLAGQPPTRELPIGLFGASTGAAAALVAAAERPERVSAVVSRGGRPDLAGLALPRVKAPTLLIVGGSDYPVISRNLHTGRAGHSARAPACPSPGARPPICGLDRSCEDLLSSLAPGGQLRPPRCCGSRYRAPEP